MAKLKASEFRFKKHETLGAEGAEQDAEYLYDCFCDNGDLDTLRNTHSPQRIVVGRTGVGKTALLLQLQQVEEKVAWLEPDELSLHYLSNSIVLRRLDELGVDLDLFYRLLWRHIFAVELVRLKYNLKAKEDKDRFINRITTSLSRDKRKQEAVDYLTKWGERFWENAECRVREVTQKFENDLKTKLASKFKFFTSEIDSASKISTEDRREIVYLAQDVVDHVQIQQLAKVMDLLQDDILSDQQQHFYIVIDRLDENWVSDRVRYRLIRALIETVKDFQRIQSAKIIISLRKDLLDRVIRATRDSGFQEEKYQSLYLKVSWTKEQLIDALNKRIQKLVERQYTKKPVFWDDLFPQKIGKLQTAEYLIDRTMYRPRDIIQFANCCLEQSIDKPEITLHGVSKAEKNYSALRFRSLGDEWISDYPKLLEASKILKKRPRTFLVKDILDETIIDLSVELVDDELRSSDLLGKMASGVWNEKTSPSDFRLKLVQVFYNTGLVGIKTSPKERISWSFHHELVSTADISEETRVHICPMFYRTLGVSQSQSDSADGEPDWASENIDFQ